MCLSVCLCVSVCTYVRGGMRSMPSRCRRNRQAAEPRVSDRAHMQHQPRPLAAGENGERSELRGGGGGGGGVEQVRPNAASCERERFELPCGVSCVLSPQPRTASEASRRGVE